MRDVNSLNRVILIGRLGGAPELRYLPQTERAIARFSLATNERFYNPNNPENQDRTEWHRIVAWGKLAEFCEKFLSQGKQICVEGKLRTRSWQDREGNKRYTTEVEAQNIVLLGRKGDTQETGSDPFPDSETDSRPSDSTPTEKTETNDDEDDIPF